MNRLLFGTLALGVMLCVLLVQSDATTLPVPNEQLSVPEPQAADTSAPAAATAETETVTEYRTEYRDFQVCGPLGCQVVRRAVRVPVQVTRKVARVAADSTQRVLRGASAVVKSATCACGCGGTCGGLCDCLNCSCKGAATGEVVRFHSVRTSPPVVTYGSTGTSAGAYRTYTRQVTYPTVQTRRVAWRPLRRLLSARGGCR